jgi:hypothetical protein
VGLKLSRCVYLFNDQTFEARNKIHAASSHLFRAQFPIACVSHRHDQTVISGPAAEAAPVKLPMSPDKAELKAELFPNAFITLRPAEPWAITLCTLALASPEHL